MCLRVDQTELKVAETDITCYKLVRRNKNGRYRTAYQNTKIPIFCMLGLKKFKANGEVLSWKLHESTMVAGGLIHTFEYIEDAVYIKTLDGDEIWECVIPKGEKYIKGEFRTFKDGRDLRCSSLAGKSIKFVKRIY